ncbi:TetR/AcrR family transcriptional regulator [Phenylobacterium sp.]|uniref:TetR/AcrR family transcriptional regulator n=1 Tax=Phenylobacterium sp. TaxID=1871053 RepID=UPI002FC9A4C2
MSPRPARDTYHHGALRAEAAQAAYDLVVEGGHEALSLRKVAERVGVAHRSLYNHFADREALLDAVAERGYVQLAQPLKGAADPAGYVAAYLGFALAHPNLYRLMRSRPHATMKLKPALQAAVHLGITEALRIFGRPERSSAENRRAVMKTIILLQGGLSMHLGGVLDVDGDEGFIAELQAMVASG